MVKKTKKIRKGPVILTVSLILLIVFMLIIKSSGGEPLILNNTTINTTLTNQSQLCGNTTYNHTAHFQNSNTTPIVIKPVKVSLTIPMGSDYTYILPINGIDPSLITAKYDEKLINVVYEYSNGKLIITLHPLKSVENAVILYYSGRQLAFFDVKPVAIGLLKVSNSIVEEYSPFKKIDKDYVFTVENPLKYEKKVNVFYAVKNGDFTVTVNPQVFTLKPGESKNITVHVSGFLKETPVTIVLTIDGVERYITLNTNPLMMDVKLLNNHVVAGESNQLKLKVSINYPMSFYLYVNGEYYKKIELKKGDNIITIDYVLPKPSKSTCYLKYVSQYGVLNIELKNPWVDKKYSFNLDVDVHYPVEFKVFKTTLSFDKYDSDNTLIIIKNNNNYPITLSPNFLLCNTTKDINDGECYNALKEFNINFYEVGGSEFNKVTLKPFQQKIYRLVVSPKKEYHVSYKKYLFITFNESSYINGTSSSTVLNRGIIISLENHVNQTKLLFEPEYSYSKTKGGVLHIKIKPLTDKILVNVTITYWLKAYNGDAFVMVKPPITLKISELTGYYDLYISLPKENDFFIFYIEGKGVNVFGSSLIYVYPSE